jgi:16S rRNA (guanine(966)-N(2))-methyltransferase RsmD
LKPAPGYEVRPTPDRSRETLFNILAPRIEGVTFVDAYAGTGAVGIEAVSRGAARAILMEKSRQALEVLEENIASLGIQGRVKVLRGSARLLLRHEGISCFWIHFTIPSEQARCGAQIRQSGSPRPLFE